MSAERGPESKGSPLMSPPPRERRDVYRNVVMEKGADDAAQCY